MKVEEKYVPKIVCEDEDFEEKVGGEGILEEKAKIE